MSAGSPAPTGLVALGVPEALTGILYTDFYWPLAAITYSIPVAGSTWPGYAAGDEPFGAQYSVLTSAQAVNFRAAVAQWDRLIAVDLVETNDLTQRGDIRVAFSDALTTTNNIWGYASVPPFRGRTAGASPEAGDIWILNTFSTVSLAPGTYDFKAAMHEIGHALGLKHPFEAPILSNSDVYDTRRYTIMSYTTPADFTAIRFTRTADGSLQANTEYAWPTTPMVLDIAAIQGRYGADPNTAKGDDVYTFDQSKPFMLSIYDAGGTDTFDLSGLTRGSAVDLRPGAYSSIAYYPKADQLADALATYANFSAAFITRQFNGEVYSWTQNVGLAFNTTIENVKGSRAGDSILGNDVANVLSGGGGDDRITGGLGDDTLSGDAGDDILDGGDGMDFATYAGVSTDFTWVSAPGGWTVRDLRTGAPEGVDMLTAIERLKFTDKIVVLGYDFAAAIDLAFANILRAGPSSSATAAVAASLSDKYAAGPVTNQAAIADLIKAADATTSVATLAYQFFTGKVPSEGGIDYLVSPTGPNPNNLNSTYYQSFSLENRYINFAVNLGKLGEGNAAFTAAFGAKSLAESTRDAYAKIFGSTPTDAKISALLDPSFALNGQTLTRAEYFAYYGQDGASGIGTKAAMVGWLLGEAVKADLGTYSKSNDAFLLDLADGATFAVDLVGTYGKPEFAYVG
ncbi:MAG: hypothetical protein EBZ50_09910 [Alphaproteobacteria bacterium]|nr:hypothetical protein [Alphaproteobacteria bacterium]